MNGHVSVPIGVESSFLTDSLQQPKDGIFLCGSERLAIQTAAQAIPSAQPKRPSQRDGSNRVTRRRAAPGVAYNDGS